MIWGYPLFLETFPYLRCESPFNLVGRRNQSKLVDVMRDWSLWSIRTCNVAVAEGVAPQKAVVKAAKVVAVVLRAMSASGKKRTGWVVEWLHVKAEKLKKSQRENTFIWFPKEMIWGCQFKTPCLSQKLDDLRLDVGMLTQPKSNAYWVYRIH